MFANIKMWTVLGLAALSAACATTGTSLRTSAERLERSSYDLVDDSRTADAGGDYRSDARALAEEARDFRRVVESRDSDADDVQDAFRDLSKRYHALRDEVDDSDSRDAGMDFKDVTQAYLDIEREVRSDRYASDRD